MKSAAELAEALNKAASAPERIAAAVAMGWHGAPEHVGGLMAKLESEPEAWVAAAYCAALEMIGEPNVSVALQRWLRQCPDAQVWNVCHTLGKLRGVDPIVPSGTDVRGLRKIWIKACDEEAVSAIKNLESDDNGVRFIVDSGQSQIRIDYDSPPQGTSNWARWNRSLLVRGRRVYSVGSTCGTCETLLTLVGWPPERALPLSRELSATMQDEVTLDSEWIQTWTPVLTQLQTGHYLGVSLRLPVERVDSEEVSWMTRRRKFRLEDPDWPSDDETPPWPGTPHFQGPMFATPPRTYWVALASQDLATLNEERVQHYMQRIRDGHRPSALTLGWMEDRYVQAEWNERVVVLAILDGHHKLEAYARLALPATVVSLFHLENTGGAPNDPSAPLLDAIRQLDSLR